MEESGFVRSLLQFGEAWVSLLLAALLLRCLSFRRLVESLNKSWRRGCLENEEVLGLALACRRAGRYSLGWGTCLPQALALAWMLTRRGASFRIVLGVRRVEGETQAHAWLEQEGRVLVGQNEWETYRPIHEVSIGGQNDS